MKTIDLTTVEFQLNPLSEEKTFDMLIHKDNVEKILLSLDDRYRKCPNCCRYIRVENFVSTKSECLECREEDYYTITVRNEMQKEINKMIKSGKWKDFHDS